MQADCLPEPRDVFTFLTVLRVLLDSCLQPATHFCVLASQENGIGQDFALYYLAYAAYMELRGNFSKADAIFQRGLERYMPSCWHLCTTVHATDSDKLVTTRCAVQTCASN